VGIVEPAILSTNPGDNLIESLQLHVHVLHLRIHEAFGVFVD